MSNNTSLQSVLSNNVSTPHCSLENYAKTFSTSIIIAVFSPVALMGNALILAAIWKKTFQRTPFHVLLSGLAVTDLCTGLIAQPFNVVSSFLFLTSDCNNIGSRKLLIMKIGAVDNATATYFITTTGLIITLMAVERWLHMSRRSLVTSRRGCFIVVVILLFPIPLAVFRSLITAKGNSANEINIALISVALFCFLTTFVAYFNVFRIIHLHRQQVQASAPSGNRFGGPGINLAKYKKSVDTILYILALFFFCFVPYTVAMGIHVSVRNEKSRELSVAVHVTTIFLFLSSSLNPGLYIWRMNDLRNGVKQLFRCNSAS